MVVEFVPAQNQEQRWRSTRGSLSQLLQSPDPTVPGLLKALCPPKAPSYNTGRRAGLGLLTLLRSISSCQRAEGCWYNTAARPCPSFHQVLSLEMPPPLPLERSKHNSDGGDTFNTLQHPSSLLWGFGNHQPHGLVGILVQLWTLSQSKQKFQPPLLGISWLLTHNRGQRTFLPATTWRRSFKGISGGQKTPSCLDWQWGQLLCPSDGSFW